MVWHVRLLSEPKLAVHASVRASGASLSAPSRALLSVAFPVTLTTDLSDAYYPLPAALYVRLLAVNEDGEESACGPEHVLQWKGTHAGTRVVKAHLQQQILLRGTDMLSFSDGLAPPERLQRLAIQVRAAVTDARDVKDLPNSCTVPEFLDVWTVPFHLEMHSLLKAKPPSAGSKPVNVPVTYAGEYWLQRRIPIPRDVWPVPKDTNVITGEEVSGETSPSAELRLLEEAGESIARHVW